MSNIPLIFNVYDTSTNEYVLKNVSYGPITELTGIGRSRIKTCCYEGELLKQRYIIDKANDTPTKEFIEDFCYKWDVIRLKLNPDARRRLHD